MRRAVKLSFVLVLFASFTFAQQTPEEQAVWKLEHQYWQYVKANDLTGYRSLWHEKFVGWPQSSAAPARKGHITDWITANTSKGVQMRTYAIKEAASQFTDNVVVTHYWVKDACGMGRRRPHASPTPGFEHPRAGKSLVACRRPRRMRLRGERGK